MKVVRPDEVPPVPANSRLFTGTVTRQELLDPKDSKFFSMSIVNFPRGVRNKFHVHSSDQLLIATKGKGIVATEHEERVVIEGDVVHVHAGEKHWHGAGPESGFSHITITAVGSETEQLED